MWVLFEGKGLCAVIWRDNCAKFPHCCVLIEEIDFDSVFDKGVYKNLINLIILVIVGMLPEHF